MTEAFFILLAAFGVGAAIVSNIWWMRMLDRVNADWAGRNAAQNTAWADQVRALNESWSLQSHRAGRALLGLDPEPQPKNGSDRGGS